MTGLDRCTMRKMDSTVRTHASSSVMPVTADTSHVRMVSDFKRLRLRRFLQICLVSVLFVVMIVMIVPGIAQSHSIPLEVETYQVMPGETLWSYAEDITPVGGDVSVTVQRLQKMNHLTSSVLYPGQSIIVPVEQ